MDEKRRRSVEAMVAAILRPMSGLAHASNDHPALAVQQRFRRTDKIMVPKPPQFPQTFGFRINTSRAPSRDKVCFPPSSRLSCLNLGLFCPN